MKIHFFTLSDARGGSSRQRVFRVAEELSKRGYDTVVHEPTIVALTRTPWPKKFRLILTLFKNLGTIRKGDVVFLHRTVGNKYFFVIIVAYLFFSRRKMLFDIDDPYYVHSFWKTKVLTQMADAVITCTHGQAEWVKKYNKKVTVVHIALAMDDYEKFTHDYTKQEGTPIIGWIGTGPEHIRNLEKMVPVFTELLKRKNSFSFTLVGALKDKNVYELFENISGLTVRFIDSLDWTDPKSTPQEIQKFAIGIIPHEHTGVWNESKSSFKVLEYMACGVATVATRFGEMPYIIEDGTSGYLALGTDEWVEKLEQLLSSHEGQVRLGKAGQERIREAYSFDATLPLYEKVLQSI